MTENKIFSVNILTKISTEILEDLRGRRGFRDMVDDLDEDVVIEILDAWNNIIYKHIKDLS